MLSQNAKLSQFCLKIPRLFAKNKIRSFSSTVHLLNDNLEQRASYPTRAVLYVPGNDSKKLGKIYSTNADCIVLDCEDGVALNRKQEAREKIRALYDTDSRIQTNSDGKFAVRINSAPSALSEEDINTLFNIKKDLIDKTPEVNLANLIPKCVFVPKTNTADDIKWLFEKIHAKLRENPQLKPSLSLFFYMESAISVINLNDIIKTSLSLSNEKYSGIFRLDGFVFGSDDYCADIGATRTKDASELVYARQKLVTYCKAYKLKVIDMVYIDFKDLEGLKVQSEQGARMGFTGKQVIHPGQVDITQEAFSPSKEKIEWASGLIEAFHQHQKSGAGAFTYKGQMIDKPSLLQAQNIMAIAEKISKN